MRLHVVFCFLLAAGTLAACDTAPIAWGDPVSISDPGGGAHLVVSAAGAPAFVRDTVAVVTPPRGPGVCTSSVRTAPAATRTFAGWWSVRPDSSAGLYVAFSRDRGATWSAPLAVDTTDVAIAGCDRPPPALTTVGDDVYVAYSMDAPEGMGVFFAHTMSGMLHSPVPVIYGERLVETAIFADNGRVAVAYEEPNGRRPRVDLAFSVTQGHIFEVHVEASRDVDVAHDPAVAFAGDRIAVSWLEGRAGTDAANRVVRVGRILR
jgi:hypothetical protein